ncbi:MAG: hypothetical protein ACTHN3_06320 [Solirubrobacterales bacterium]
MTPAGERLAAIAAARRDRDRESDELYGLELQRLRLQRSLPAEPELEAGAKAKLGRLEAEIADKRKALVAGEARLGEAIGTLLGEEGPEQLIESWDETLPILLLPLRIETRWRLEQEAVPRRVALDGPELWVRVYPDDVAQVTHEKVLTDAEVEGGHAYWSARHAAANDEEREEAWVALANRFGANRASWVARETKPANWEAAEADPKAQLEFPEPGLTKPDSWTTAPHTRVLPDQFVLLAWRGEELVVNQTGARVDDVVVLGPSPLDDREGTASISRDGKQQLQLDDSFSWIRDFGKAVDAGLGFRVKLKAEDVEKGFDRLVVLGVKHSAGPDESAELLEDLIANHHYSLSGFSLLPQGSATNNTTGNETPYARAGRSGAESGPEVGPPQFEATADRALASDGQRFADYLGISYEPLENVEGAGHTDHLEAVAMNRALYAGTLGYYFDHMLNDVLDEEGFEALRRHFTDHVSGRGPLPAIRVGSQPYGVIPTSAFGRWSVASRGRQELDRIGFASRFEAFLYAVLVRLDAAWSTLVPRLAQIGAPGDGAANLLEVLGLQPTTAELYRRVGYSWDYLRNLDEFAFGGRYFGDFLKMAIEGQMARGFLSELGYRETGEEGGPKPLPLLLQLIWRHSHDPRIDPKQLIDGQPLSEDATIKPYDPARPDNYVDWLQANASDADKLEAQDFGGAAPPSALLYMMLRFSLLMEAQRAIHAWLGARGVEAPELVRSRKFLNIGPQASPSPWEVFRTPANRLVAEAEEDSPLLKVVYFPLVSEEEGRHADEQLKALAQLRGVPTARLERALSEHVDTLSYRLDSWQTSLFARRLHARRRLDDEVANRRTGIYLGAYGFLENLHPKRNGRTKVSEDRLPPEMHTGVDNLYVESKSGGYVHSPSLNHATAAALLRNGYLTHATPDQPEALAVDLSSDRVRRASYLLEGIRGGQSLEVLLGVQFERGLHDWTTRAEDPVVVEQFKPAFRAAFPIRRTRVPQAADSGAGAATVTEDHEVVNGLDLAITTQAFPYGVEGLGAASADQRGAIEAERENVANTLDSLRDVLTAEAAYQLALGNFDRAAAIVRSTGDGNVPPDVEVLRTPRGTDTAFTQRLAVTLDSTENANPWPGVPLTLRAKLEPPLNHWVGGLLGDPAEISCKARALAADGSVLVVGGNPVEGPVTLADLGVQPLDFVYMVRRETEESGAAELESRVRYAFARKHGLADEVVVEASFAEAGAAAPARPFAEALALADRIRQLLGSARPLGGGHFQSATSDEKAPAGNPDRIDLAELLKRVGDRIGETKPLLEELSAKLTAAAVTPPPATAAEDLREALVGLADSGFAYALPRSMVGSAELQLEVLQEQGKSILATAEEAKAKIEGLLEEAAKPEGTATIRTAKVVEAVRAWAGGDFLLLPRFELGDPAGVAEAHAARAQLLAFAKGAGVAMPVREWLQGAACVRPLVHDFELLRTIADTLSDQPLALAPLQLPHRPGDSWLGSQFPLTTEIVHDTVSLVQHLPQGFHPSQPQCGLLIDEWVETIPKHKEITGLAFNFDAPNSAPPQALLLAVSPQLGGGWKWEDLVDTVLDTFRRARLRAVEPDALGDLPAIGTLLPAVIAEFSTSPASVSLDYAFVYESIREQAMAQMASSKFVKGGS